MKSFPALRAIFLVVVLCANVRAAGEAQEAEVEEPSFPLPDEYSTNYIVAADTVSPDKKFALIVPKDDPEAISPPGKNHVVALQPFAILATLPTESPYFVGQSHGGISAEWSEDRSIALVTLAGRWGARDMFLLELRDGKLARTTDLLAKLYDLLLPDYRKVRPKPEPYNEELAFIFVGEDPVGTLEGSARIKIDANAATDPKSGDPHRWKAHVTATWDIAQAKFTNQKITRVRSRD